MKDQVVMLCLCLLGVLALVGCTEWVIPSCAGTPFKTPCVGPCTVAVLQSGRLYPRDLPLASGFRQKGTRHCQEIQPDAR